MDSRPLGIAALALAVIGAAGVGSYMALRPSQVPVSAEVAATNPGQTPSAKPADAARNLSSACPTRPGGRPGCRILELGRYLGNGTVLPRDRRAGARTE